LKRKREREENGRERNVGIERAVERAKKRERHRARGKRVGERKKCESFRKKCE
jgi:hypothetical protein